MRKPARVCLLDELRGLAVLLMIFYHGAYDAVYIFRFTGSGWFISVPMDFLQRYIAVSFILIAGIMGRYSRSNFRRGAKTFLCGLLVTAVTLLVMPSERILFGILHFLGAAMMLLGKNATVTICHTKTRDVQAVAREADILVSAAGVLKSLTKDYVRPGQIVIDVSMNWDPDKVTSKGKGGMAGDAVFTEVEPIVEAITPVPGGVGAVTTSVLIGHVVEAAERTLA